MKMRNLFAVVWGGMLMTTLSSCDGILEGIYDDPKDIQKTEQYGFVETPSDLHPGKIYIDASSYQEWHYIDLRQQKIETVDILQEKDREPDNWDLALHRYDFKTNGAEVMQTNYEHLDDLVRNGKMPDGKFVKDDFYKEKVIISMENMVISGPDYVPSFVNAELSRWMDVDISTMPPTYTLSQKVYVVKFKDNTYAALQMPDFRNKSGLKGFITIAYIYPLQIQQE